jgi:hypothetical protein
MSLVAFGDQHAASRRAAKLQQDSKQADTKPLMQDCACMLRVVFRGNTAQELACTAVYAAAVW